MNTGNTVLYICAEQIGLTGTDMLSTNVDMDVYAQDWYYGGPGDWVTDLTVTPLGEQYFGSAQRCPGQHLRPNRLVCLRLRSLPGQYTGIRVYCWSPMATAVAGARGGATQDTEALLFFGPSSLTYNHFSY